MRSSRFISRISGCREQRLGDLDRVERRALPQVVRAAEQRERVGAAGHLPDPARLGRRRGPRHPAAWGTRPPPGRPSGVTPGAVDEHLARLGHVDRAREARQDRDRVPGHDRHAHAGGEHVQVGGADRIFFGSAIILASSPVKPSSSNSPIFGDHVERDRLGEHARRAAARAVGSRERLDLAAGASRSARRARASPSARRRSPPGRTTAPDERSPAARCSGPTASIAAIVVQFGTAMMPGLGQPSSASGFTSGIDQRARRRSIRNALELSMHTVPCAGTIVGQERRDVVAPAETNATSTPASASTVSSRTSCSSPRERHRAPGAPRRRERHERHRPGTRAPRGCGSSPGRPRRWLRSPRPSCEHPTDGPTALTSYDGTVGVQPEARRGSPQRHGRRRRDGSRTRRGSARSRSSRC